VQVRKKNSNAVSCVTVVVVVVVAMVVTAVVSPFYSMRNCIASAVLAIAIPSVCLSVCHTPVLCHNDGT